MDRQSIFDKFNVERDYQIDKWGNDKETSLGDFIIYMERYLQNAKDAYVSPDEQFREETLNQIMKVSTIGIAAMEKFG